MADRSNVNTDLIKESNPIQESDTSIDLMLLNISKSEKAQLVAAERIHKAQKLWDEKIFKIRAQQIKAEYKNKADRDRELAKLKEKSASEIYDIARRMEDNFYKFSNLKTKHKIMEERRETAKNYREKLIQEASLQATMSDNGRLTAEQQQKLNENIKKSHQQEIAAAKQTMQLAKAQRTYDTKSAQAKLNAISAARQNERDAHQENISRINEEIKQKKAALKKAKAEGKDTTKLKEDLKESEKEKKAATKEAKKSDAANFGKELKESVKQGLEKGVSGFGDIVVRKLTKGVDDAIESVGEHRSAIEARLQGTESGYDEVAKTLKQSLAVSPYVKQTEVLKKLKDAVDKGIAYNVEQRAFLSTMTDKIVSTFDAFDSNLMRIIRLQQADTTAARMGMEAELLQFFNSTFSDSSYLSEGYDDVSKALVDANAQMTREMSVAFEYNVQKWMGALASLGFGTDTITKIATGINYLGTGNVQALSGDTQLMNLLAMSASRSGYPLADLLVEGIDDSSVNALLKSMVEYLAEIAEDDNAVVKAAYGDVFSFSQSDLRAIKNLTEDDITNIYDQKIDYSKAVQSTQDQLNMVGSRLSMTEMIDNVFDNFVYSTGESIGNSVVGAITWKLMSLIDEATGGDLKIPEFMAAGFGINITSSIPNLIKTGMFGLAAVGQIGNIISSIGSGGGMDLGIWDADEYTSRGGKFESTVGGVQKTTSGSRQMKTSSSSADTKKSAIDSTSEDQEESKKRSKEASKDEITLETLYKEIFEKKSIIYVKDAPVLNKVETIARSTAAIQSHTNAITSKINNYDSSIKVHVSNMGALTDVLNSMRKVDIEKMFGYTTMEKWSNELAKQILNVLQGTDTEGRGYNDDDNPMIKFITTAINRAGITGDVDSIANKITSSNNFITLGNGGYYG